MDDPHSDPLSLLLPGDCLLYRPKGFFGWLIAVKTWARIAHCEMYFGRGWSVASRDGEGVNYYPVREDRLAAVLRPKKFFDMPAAMKWFRATAWHQKYDWLGLLCFTLAKSQSNLNKMWCSEFLTRCYRQGGFHPFAPWWDADRIAPAQFIQSSEFDMVWHDGKRL